MRRSIILLLFIAIYYGKGEAQSVSQKLDSSIPLDSINFSNALVFLDKNYTPEPKGFIFILNAGKEQRFIDKNDPYLEFEVPADALRKLDFEPVNTANNSFLNDTASDSIIASWEITEKELLSTDEQTIRHDPSDSFSKKNRINSYLLPTTNDAHQQLSSELRFAKTFLEKRKYEEGIAICKKIISVNDKNNIDKNLLFEVNSILGNVYGIVKQYDSALMHNRSALKLADKFCLGVSQTTKAYRDLGLTLTEMGDKKNGLEAYLKAVEIAKTGPVKQTVERDLGILYLLIAGCYEELQYYLTMGSYLDKYRDLNINFFHDVDLEFYRLSSIQHKINGEYALALNALESMNNLNDSLHTLSLSEKLLTLNKQDKVEATEKESVIIQRNDKNKILKKVASRDKRIFYLKVLLGGLSIIAIVIFAAFYKNKSHSEELARMNTIINSQRDEIESSLDNQKELNKKLHKSNETLEHFFSIIAHDLRSPYNVMLGYTDILVSKFDAMNPTEVKECLETLRRKAYKNYQLTQNLLEWARTQKQGMFVNKRDSYIQQIVSKSMILHKELANKKEITLINRCPKQLQGNIDKDIASSVLSNLVNNALKFTGHLGSVTISAKRMGQKVLFKIDDTGHGMCKRTKDNLFNLSKVSSKPGTADEPGAGLGLILCKEMVTLHDGVIRVKSTEGKGTTVLALL